MKIKQDLIIKQLNERLSAFESMIPKDLRKFQILASGGDPVDFMGISLAISKAIDDQK